MLLLLLFNFASTPTIAFVQPMARQQTRQAKFMFLNEFPLLENGQFLKLLTLL